MSHQNVVKSRYKSSSMLLHGLIQRISVRSDVHTYTLVPCRITKDCMRREEEVRYPAALDCWSYWLSLQLHFIVANAAMSFFQQKWKNAWKA